MLLKPALSVLDRVLPHLCFSETLQAASAVLICSLAFAFYLSSRLLAAHASEAVLEELLRLASSPAEAAALGVLVFCAVLYNAGPSRLWSALLAPGQLKLMFGALVALRHSRQGTSSPPGCAALEASLPAPATVRETSSGSEGGSSPGGPPSATASGASPRKDVPSHRLAERRAKHRHRWSFDVVPTSGPRREPTPRQRAASLDRAASPVGTASPTTMSAPTTPRHGQEGQEAASAGGDQRSGRHWQPAMPRIASGKELVDLARRRLSIDNTRPPPEQQQQPAGPSPAPAPVPPATAAAAAPGPLIRWLPSVSNVQQQPPAPVVSPVSQPGLAPAPSAPASLDPYGHPVAAAASSASLEQEAKGEQPQSPSKVAAAVGEWWAHRSAALTSWASSTMDSVLQLVQPGTKGPAADGDALQRAQSAPPPSSGQPAQPPHSGDSQGEGGLAGLLAGMRRRRSSMDGGASNSYTHGRVVADPSRLGKLEQYARAARFSARGSSLPLGSLASPNPQALAAALVPSLGSDAPTSAVASVGLDGDCPQEVREAVTDEDLVQFGALIGEEAALKTSADLGISAPVGTPRSLYGPLDALAKEHDHDGWEQIVDESRPGVLYKAWRKLLRNGLYIYRSSTVLPGVSPRELRAFHLDDQVRLSWDDSAMSIERVPPPSAPQLSRCSESCLHRFRSRFPMPMAARSYDYARRVWHRPSDGGCYMICRTIELPQEVGKPRGVQVSDYVSCAAIRTAEGGAELLTMYFEDSGVRPGLAKMAVPKGLFPFMIKYEKALRATCMERVPEVGGGRTPRASLDGGSSSTAVDRGATAAQRQRGGRTSLPGGGARLAARRRAGRAGHGARREEDGAVRHPPLGGKVLRSVVLATGFKLAFDLMVRR